MSNQRFEGINSPRKEWCQARFEQLQRWVKGDVSKALERIAGLESLLHERDGLPFSDLKSEHLPAVPQFLGNQTLGYMVDTYLGKVWIIDIRNDHGGVMTVAFSLQQAREIHRRLSEALFDPT